MIALSEEVAVRPGRAQECTDFIVTERKEWTFLRQQLMSIREKDRVRRGEALQNSLPVVHRILRRSIELRTVVPRFDRLAFPNQMHAVGSRRFPLAKRMRRDLALRSAETTDVDALVLAIAPDSFRTQLHAQHGGLDGLTRDS